MNTASYPFTQEQAQQAFDHWGCNCGPAALAFALQSSLDHAHALIPGFDDKKYTSPSMMSHAITMGQRVFDAMPARVPEGDELSPMFSTRFSLVRIQWAGPWTAPGANPKWAYRQTHWITTWEDFTLPMVFDINGGIMQFCEWKANIVPQIVASIPRASGEWFPTHIWRLK